MFFYVSVFTFQFFIDVVMERYGEKKEVLRSKGKKGGERRKPYNLAECVSNICQAVAKGELVGAIDLASCLIWCLYGQSVRAPGKRSWSIVSR